MRGKITNTRALRCDAHGTGPVWHRGRVTVQPGSVTSKFGATGTSNAGLPNGSIFAPLAKHTHVRAVASQEGAIPARDFTRHVAMTALADSAPMVVRVDPHSFPLPFFKRCPPKRMLGRKLSRVFGLDRLRRVGGGR